VDSIEPAPFSSDHVQPTLQDTVGPLFQRQRRSPFNLEATREKQTAQPVRREMIEMMLQVEMKPILAGGAGLQTARLGTSNKGDRQA
jgi:hypothetical protein